MAGPRMSRAPVRPERRRVAALLGAGLGLAVGGAPAAAEEGGRMAAILQGLDKTTARVSTIEAPLDEVARFGSLKIVARACHKKPPTETPESTAFLEIVDVRPDSPAVRVFTGWMFASSPAVSALEHPVYDIWVLDCRRLARPEAAETAQTGEAAASEAARPPQEAPQEE